ncbi:MAG: DUF448 domain-containing protein [Bacilli bacterium]|nr:DUF448 domain-containing protein [Bacilli bacterium]
MQIINPRSSSLSRKKGRKEDFLRFIILDDRLVYDEGRNLKGRGIYLLKEEIPLALKKRFFSRYLHRELNEEELTLLERIK